MNKPDETDTKTIGPIRAVLAGQLFVNLPMVTIFLLIRNGGEFLFPDVSIWLLLIVGFITAWLWWRFSMPKWREWNRNVGTSPETSEKLASWTLLNLTQRLPIEEANAENEEEKATDTE